MTIIRNNITNKKNYDDVEVTLSVPLLNMAINRNWVGKDINTTRPFIFNSTKGLSPFLVIDLAEDQVASINKYNDALTQSL